MQTARMEKNLSQKDVAQKINEKQSVLQDYEAGKAIPNPQILALHSALHAALASSLSTFATTHATHLARSRAHQAELLRGPAALRDECARLRAVRDVCASVGERWAGVVRGGEERLGEVRRRGEVGVDEMVCASSIVGNQ